MAPTLSRQEMIEFHGQFILDLFTFLEEYDLKEFTFSIVPPFVTPRENVVASKPRMEVLHPFTGISLSRAVTKEGMFRWLGHCIRQAGTRLRAEIRPAALNLDRYGRPLKTPPDWNFIKNYRT
jgi:hypothetical protein